MPLVISIVLMPIEFPPRISVSKPSPMTETFFKFIFGDSSFKCFKASEKTFLYGFPIAPAQKIFFPVCLTTILSGFAHIIGNLLFKHSFNSVVYNSRLSLKSRGPVISIKSEFLGDKLSSNLVLSRRSLSSFNPIK